MLKNSDLSALFDNSNLQENLKRIYRDMSLNSFVENDGVKKLIIVEGGTDKTFYSQYIAKNNTVIINARMLQDIPDSMRGAKTDGEFPTSYPNKDENKKQFIINLILALERYRNLIDIPDIVEKFDVYGIIDKDDGNDCQYPYLNKLFITDTHDLETLILSTDEDVIYRLGYDIGEIEYRRSLFLAYQLGVIKAKLKNNNLTSETCKNHRENYFWDFVNLINNDNDLKINLDKVIGYINAHNSADKQISDKSKRMLYTDKSVKKVFDDELNWKGSFEQFLKEQPKDLWDIVNGHDIVAALKFVNKGVNDVLSGTRPKERWLESRLIKYCKHEKFFDTEISKKLKKQKLIA